MNREPITISIKRVVNNIIENYPQYDYVVVSDGSKDNTAKLCRDKSTLLYDKYNIEKEITKVYYTYIVRHQFYHS